MYCIYIVYMESIYNYTYIHVFMFMHHRTLVTMRCAVVEWLEWPSGLETFGGQTARLEYDML